jgi:hypothetical protein
MAREFPFVLQNEQPEMQLATGEDPELHMPALKSLAAFFGSDPGTLAAFYRKHCKVFFSTEEWFSWIKDYDFSIGSRFHGNVAALLNGVPAVVLTHDSRTKELCEFASIPHVSVSDIQELNAQRLYEQANFELFEERYNTLYRNYTEFLDENDVPHKLAWKADLPPRGSLKSS